MDTPARMRGERLLLLSRKLQNSILSDGTEGDLNAVVWDNLLIHLSKVLAVPIAKLVKWEIFNEEN